MSNAAKIQPPRIKTKRPIAKKQRLFVVSVTGVVFVVAAAILFIFDPVQSSFYPVCTFKRMTGWSCPACGCLRASHQLLHGHLATAFRLNPLFILTIPLIGLFGLEQMLGKPIVKKPPLFGWLLLAIFVLFGILRNLPPFLTWSGQ